MRLGRLYKISLTEEDAQEEKAFKYDKSLYDINPEDNARDGRFMENN